MPIKGNVRYRVKTTKSGKKVRLAFKGNKVVETKNLETGKMHTQAEFKRDKKKKSRKKSSLIKGHSRTYYDEMRGMMNA